MSAWWKIWSLALFAKLLLASQIPLAPDEAYYWVWSQNPSLSYFDHPPAIAWLMALGDWLPRWALRWPAIGLAHFSLWFMARFSDRWLNETRQIWFLIFSLFMPLVGLGAIIATPDLPLLFSWSFALWAFHNLFSQDFHWKRAMLLGLALGLGLLSKYHIVLLGPIGLLMWWTSPRRLALLEWLPLTLATALLVSSPVWIWNFQNDWASFRFQIDHGLGRAWKPKWTRDYLALQIALVFPTTIWLALKSKVPFAVRFAAWFPLVFFFLTSFRGYVEANWPIVAHPLVLSLALTNWPLWRKTLLATLSLWIALVLSVIGLALTPMPPAWVSKTKLRDLYRFDKLAQAAREIDPLYARSYQMAATLSFKLRHPVAKLRGMNRRDLYDALPQSLPSGNKIYLAVERGDVLPSHYDEWKKTAVILVDSEFEIWELQLQ